MIKHWDLAVLVPVWGEAMAKDGGSPCCSPGPAAYFHPWTWWLHRPDASHALDGILDGIHGISGVIFRSVGGLLLVLILDECIALDEARTTVQIQMPQLWSRTMGRSSFKSIGFHKNKSNSVPNRCFNSFCFAEDVLSKIWQISFPSKSRQLPYGYLTWDSSPDHPLVNRLDRSYWKWVIYPVAMLVP